MTRREVLMASSKQAVTAKRRPRAAKLRHCGLCRKTRTLTKTECCGQWICDDEGNYVLFSYARNSCYRNHSRYTLCGFHHTEEHPGRWTACTRCRDEIAETEMYVWYGTNEYNFETLKNPPAYEPTRCAKCRKIIVLSRDAYTTSGKGYFCSACFRFP
jgi:hypothetical protein